MKKPTSLLPLLIMSCSLMSQSTATKLNHPSSKNNNQSNNGLLLMNEINNNRSPQVTFWSDQFSVPANWTIASSVGTGVWTIGTAGPSGGFPITPINSTTKTNGFGLFDSDKDCSITTGQIADITTANSINCSTHPFVNLQFQQQYKRFSDSTFVFVSNNGTSWTKYPVNVNLNDNDFCPTNPEIVKINITATAGNKATVWIRFEFYSPSTLGGAPGCAYSWMIDDVSLMDIPANDVSLDRAYIDFGYMDGGYYTQTPKTQIQPVSFRAVAKNLGSSAQTNVKLNVNISNGTSSVYNQNSSVIASLPYLAIDTLKIPTPVFTPLSQILSYTAKFRLSQTETELTADTLNNSMVSTFAITDTIYARDNGILSSTTSPNFFVGGEEDLSEIANLFEIPVKAQASSVSVYVDTASTLNTAIQARIYELIAGVPTLVANSPDYAITSAAQKGKWVTLPVSIILKAGGSYLASILCSNTTAVPPVSQVVLGADRITKQPSGTTLLYLSTATPPDWYNTKALPMIRLNIKSGFVGIDEVSKNSETKLFQNNPNPFNKTSVINYELMKSASVSLEIYDLTGRKLFALNEGIQNSGMHSINIDGSQFSPGVYFYSLKAGDTTLTKRMVITQ